MIVLIDNYDSFTYNLYQYFEELRVRTRVVRNDCISLEGIRKLKPQAVVISPGPGNPDSSGVSLAAIEKLAGEVPVLGVCLGHQAIGQVFGGRVIRARRLMHGKTTEITHNGKGLFIGLPKRLNVTRYHSLIVERKTLPSCLEISAESEDGTIMGLRHRKFNVHGVQFHPESIMTEHGKDMLRNFLAGAAK
ncbi:MAG: aminodeoxychorismate/anthranilate synthase component II [Deltaproteobacteria bacterium]|nr:aminodeoxychorismate/anthranilate synthase component II [Deltaproteobacteria bacterium]